MSSSEFIDVSSESLNILEKIPKNLLLSFTPMNSVRTQGVPRNIQNSPENLDLFERRSSRQSLKSPYRKKQFLSQKKSINPGLVGKRRENVLNSNELNKQAFTTTPNAIILARRFLKKFRRRKSYFELVNLRDYHYKLIGDAAAQGLEIEHTKKRDRRNAADKIYLNTKCQQMISYLKLQSLKNKIFDQIPKFNPNSPLKLLWDIFLLVISIIGIYIYSIEKFFKTDINLNLISTLVVILFYIDLFVKLNTKYYFDGIQITSRRQIVLNYLKNFLFTDVIPCLALSLYNFTKLEQLFDIHLTLFFRVLRGNELGNRIVEQFFQSERAISIYKLIILFLKIFAWGHIIACLWHYTGYMANIEEPDGINWLKNKGILNSDWKDRYLFSIYWSVTTMMTVGYGDITPTNSKEMYFNLFAMILGCGVFGYSMNNIGEILKYGSKKDRNFKNQMRKVDLLLKEKGLPLEIQTKVKKYLEFVWKQEQKEDTEGEELIMSKLNSNLRSEVYFHSNVKFLKNVPSFKNFADDTLVQLASHMKKIRISPEEYIFREGDFEESHLYFIIDGKVELLSEKETAKGKFSVKWKTFNKDSYFGVQEMYTGKPRRTSALSLEFGTLFHLSRNDVLKVLKKNPLEYEKFCLYKDMELVYDNQQQFEISCESCGFNDHDTRKCKFLSFEPDRLKIIGKHNFKKVKKFKQIKRKQRRRINALLTKNAYNKSLGEFLLMYHDDEELCDLIKELKKEDHEIDLNEISPKLEEQDASKELRKHNSIVSFSDSMNPNGLHEEARRLTNTRKLSSYYIHSHKRRTILQPNDGHRSPGADNKHEKAKNVPKEVGGTGAQSISKNKKEINKDESWSMDKMKTMKYYFPSNNVESILTRLAFKKLKQAT